MSGRSWSFYKDVVPVMVMIGIQSSDMGLLTLFKAATLRGMSNHVFVAYAYALATILLLPLVFMPKNRSTVLHPLTFSILAKIILLGVIGSSSQVLGYAAISYSSPSLASSISNLVPAFTFLLAVMFRMEKVAAKSRSSQAKVIGSIISISGAFVLTFYKGQPINISILHSVDTSWVTAATILTADYLLVSLWYILQVEILKEYPDKISLVFIHDVTATILTVTVALLTEPNASSWKIGLDISLVSIVCSGIFGKFISNAVYAWALQLKGAVYVASFTPVSVVIAVAMGVMFLGDALHIGSIVGSTIISVGLYTVLWGKATEETEDDDDVGNSSQESPTTTETENVPLLQNYEIINSEKKIDVNV